MPGIFITLEGIDGSGKSTLANRLAEELKTKGHKVYLTREPGSLHREFFARDDIRKLLLEKRGELTPMSQVLLYAADRNLHYEQEITPALNRNEIVICDRHLDSSIAYQSAQGEVSYETVVEVQKIATNNRFPHLTLYLDLPAALALSRADARGSRDRMEDKGLDFLASVAVNYDRIMSDTALHNERFVRLDAARAQEATFEEAFKIVFDFISKK